MAKIKIIYCPKCNRKVTKWDGKSSINPVAKCQKCNKLVVYDIKTEEVKRKIVPERTTSSGMRFY